MDQTDPMQVAAAAAQGFKLFQCEECAKSIRNALVAGGHSGRVIELRVAEAPDKVDFMICLSYDKGQSSITQNGRHLGVQVGDMMFDNLHPQGMPRDDWIRDFRAFPGVVVYRVDSF